MQFGFSHRSLKHIYRVPSVANMGRIKTRSIKSTGRQLYKTYPDLFKKDFQSNKKTLAKILDTDSKRTLNKVAGYITRLVRVKEHQIEQTEVL
jgi:small subunit ribosomal protein S17e